jgi:hypothetical protein
LSTEPRFYTGKPRDISIFFDRSPSVPGLEATVQAYRSESCNEDGTSPRKVDFPRDRVPSHLSLQRWVERQIHVEARPTFRHSLQSFLYAYAEHGYGLPKHGLLSKVHRMNCFFRLWKTSSFWCRDPSNNIVKLPPSVQAQLRNIAFKALDSIEHDVLKDLDECLTQQGPPKPDEKVAIWASMWQLILIYRDLIVAYHSHLGQLKNTPQGDQAFAAQCRPYQKLIDSFFPLMAVFYRYQFRTKKSLEMSMDWLKPSKVATFAYEAMCRSAGQMLACRNEMYQEFLGSRHAIDQRLCEFVVKHEVKKLNARTRPTKASSKSKSNADEDDDDFE